MGNVKTKNNGFISDPNTIVKRLKDNNGGSLHRTQIYDCARISAKNFIIIIIELFFLKGKNDQHQKTYDKMVKIVIRNISSADLLVELTNKNLISNHQALIQDLWNYIYESIFDIGVLEKKSLVDIFDLLVILKEEKMFPQSEREDLYQLVLLNVVQKSFDMWEILFLIGKYFSTEDHDRNITVDIWRRYFQFSDVDEMVNFLSIIHLCLRKADLSEGITEDKIDEILSFLVVVISNYNDENINYLLNDRIFSNIGNLQIEDKVRLLIEVLREYDIFIYPCKSVEYDKKINEDLFKLNGQKRKKLYWSLSGCHSEILQSMLLKLEEETINYNKMHEVIIAKVKEKEEVIRTDILRMWDEIVDHNVPKHLIRRNGSDVVKIDTPIFTIVGLQQYRFIIEGYMFPEEIGIEINSQLSDLKIDVKGKLTQNGIQDLNGFRAKEELMLLLEYLIVKEYHDRIIRRNSKIEMDYLTDNIDSGNSGSCQKESLEIPGMMRPTGRYPHSDKMRKRTKKAEEKAKKEGIILPDDKTITYQEGYTVGEGPYREVVTTISEKDIEKILG